MPLFIGKKRRNDDDKNKAKHKLIEIDGGYVSFREIINATNNFSLERRIGSGGFGNVYKGILRNGVKFAVKKLSPRSKSRQGISEFYTEVKLLSSLKHKHIVRLYGSYSRPEHHLLVYEYMENHSLQDALYGNLPRERGRLKSRKLAWNIRHRICLGIARGLAYLHEEISPRVIIHRDIKPANILLDENFNAKISDFGLARLFEKEGTHIETKIAGTEQYMAPEYAGRGSLSEKVDVYSFGAVLLEIVGQRVNRYFLDSQGELLSPLFMLEWNVDDYIRNNSLEFPDEQSSPYVKLAMECMSCSPDLRPKMSDVVSILEGKKKLKFIRDFSFCYEFVTTSDIEEENSLVQNSSSSAAVNEEKNSLVQNSSSSESSSFLTYDCKHCGEHLCMDSTKKNLANNALTCGPVSSYFRKKQTHKSNYPAKCVSLPDIALASPLLHIESSPRVIKKNEEGIEGNNIKNYSPKRVSDKDLNPRMRVLPLCCEDDRGKSSVLVLAYEVATETSAATNCFENNTHMELDNTVAKQLPPIDPGKIQIEIELETGRLSFNELTDHSCKDSLEVQARILVETEAEEVGEAMVDDLPNQVVETTKPQIFESSLIPMQFETDETLQLSLIDAPESQSDTSSLPNQNATNMCLVAVATSFKLTVLQEKFTQICSSSEATQERVVFERPVSNLNRTVEIIQSAKPFVEGLRQTLANIEPDDVSKMVNMSRHIFSVLDMMNIDYNCLIDEVEKFINICQTMTSSNRDTQVSTFKDDINKLLKFNRQTMEESIQAMPLLRERALKTENKVAALRAKIEELEIEIVEARCQLEYLNEAMELSFEELHGKMALFESLNQEETTLITLLKEAEEEERRINESRVTTKKNFLLCRDQMKATAL